MTVEELEQGQKVLKEIDDLRSIVRCLAYSIEKHEAREQTPDSEKSAAVAILPSANWPERDYYPDMLAAAAYANYTPDTRAGASFAVGGIIPGPCLELEADPGELIVPADQLRRVLTTSNAADIVAAYMAQADEDAPASWTGTENRPPGACIGGRTPINGNYYYYVWFEEPPTEGETYEQKAGPQPPARQTGRHEETGTPGLYHCPKSP